MKIFFTNLPSFYKINLYNAINEKLKILVVFTGLEGETRNADFMNGSMKFQHIELSGSQWKMAWNFVRIVSKTPHTELVLSCYNTIVPWIAAFLFPKGKNAMVFESSIKESKVSGLKGWLKRRLMSRCVKAYVSGQSQKELALALNPNFTCIVTKGVGVFNYIKQPPYEPRDQVRRFVYVGRLVREKNLEFLIRRFNLHPELQLDIIGFGPLEAELKAISKSNIHFLGAVNNTKLPEYYQKSDVFILPSVIEPWGLVVEEAFNNGLPVMVSENVGCAEEIVNEGNGVVFRLNEEDFELKLMQICNIELYNRMRLNISYMDFEMIERAQVDCYIEK